MKSENSSFLPHFLTEEVYVIDNSSNDNKNQQSTIENVSIEKLKTELNKTPEHLTYSGLNQKEILVLINYPDGILANDRELLFKILAAINLTENDIALINLAINNTEQQASLLAKLPCQKVISFGTACSSLFPEDTPNYQISSINNRTILKSHSIHDIAADTEKKKLLWAQLQKAFKS
ncbi:MAG: hypothetical protein OEW67_00500 [Cyclobacteriaceae bacterium]|nr:hypothetical protein [Cyclobacteriaceae bacterium]